MPIKNINIGDISLNVLETCPPNPVGPPLLFVHGFPLNHTMWQGQIDHFGQTRQVLAPDLRGFGGSDVTEHPVKMEQFADDIANLLDVCEVNEPVAYCGLSMGGYIGWQFWRRHRERLSHLILCDTRAIADDEAMKQHRERTATKVEEIGSELLAELMPPSLYAEETMRDQSSLVEGVKEVIRSNSATGIVAALRGMATRPDMTDELAEIDLPSLAICGEKDEISPADEMKQFAAKMPHCEFVAISGTGHMSPQEDPATVNAAIERFLDE